MSQQTPEQQDQEIVISVADGVGRILLNRPKALNALTLDKIRVMDKALRAWAVDDAVHCVIIEGAGEKAFCAGGDIRKLYEAGKSGDSAFLAAFFGEEYRLNRLIKTYPKPYVALMDGITMGGGVGVSVHGSHRVCSERTLFAMPETGIGMLPDVGGTYFLPRLPGAVGMYLALTGARMKAADCLYTGVATHFVPTERHKELIAALCEAERDARTADDMQTAVTCVLDMFYEEPGAASLALQRDVINRCFSGASVEEIFANLEKEGGEWAEKTLETLRSKSPTALRVAFRQMQVGAQLDFDRCMQIEYRLSQRLAATHDFREGVRAVIVDKDNAPRWDPARLEDVDPAAVDALFGPLPDGDLSFD
ncbi:enoyl-CoA hydratase/isomerase family protein [Novispirillum sp. DQ9]|uniref:enoyl-CoA hydratase/isomerase family protein n=1 Tax=Novispirillum sp. DQ9 TaxID=3398612 RepID=UPI003C7A7D67